MASVAREHTEWLALIDITGPFLSLNVLTEQFNTGLPTAEMEIRTLRQAHGEWESAPHGELDHAWVQFIIHQVLGWPEHLVVSDQSIPQTLNVPAPDHSETLRPTIVLLNPPSHETSPGMPRILIQRYPRIQRLEGVVSGHRWAASPALRMQTMLVATGVRLGLVTNGEQWMLVAARSGIPTTNASWYANIWLDEPKTFDAWWNLLQTKRLFGVQPQDTLEGLLDRSLDDVEEVTNTLGEQVRNALEMLVRDLERIDQDRHRTLLVNMKELDLYEAALSVMMRLVFLLSAEERGLMPQTDVYQMYYAISTLREQLDAIADRDDEAALEVRYDAWSRLLAAFRLIHSGCNHEELLVRAYGGHLFDPDRFPFLEGRSVGQTVAEAQPLPVTNRTVLHLLRSLQLLQMRVGQTTEPRRLSFKALDVEQIGHVYESLLDHTAIRAAEPVLPLRANKGARVSELTLAEMEAAYAKGEEQLLEMLKDATKRSPTALRKDLNAVIDGFEESRLLVACGNDDKLLARVMPFAALLRRDHTDRPLIYLQGSLYVSTGEDRRSTGTHYTPRSLTEPIVKHTLDPLVYYGPAEGLPEDQWVLKSPREILSLTVCDMAMGSGAFLVQSARYLADQLLEAWQIAEQENNQLAGPYISPDAALSQGLLTEELLATNPEERRILALRLICDRCLYGVDRNPMATEMAKLSLWLTTLARDRPFTFLDHALRAGDSLTGIYNADQLILWSLKMEGDRQHVIFQEQIKNAIERATTLRQRIAERTDRDVRDLAEKARLLQEAEKAMELARLGADLLIGIELGVVSRYRSGKSLELLAKFSVVMEAQAAIQQEHFSAEGAKPSHQGLVDLRGEADRLLNGIKPFHWCLEFPEVFPQKNPGFSAIVGNPPFMGGQKITGNLSPRYRDYLVEHIANGKTGSADLCAYFFLRSGHLLNATASAGLLATNTIAQGDTREVGLDQLTERGMTITRAISSERWPGTASLEVAHIWLRSGVWHGQHVLEHIEVSSISSYLSSSETLNSTPYTLKANENKSFIGSYVLGMGFILTPEEAQVLIEHDPRNGDVLFPYLNGEDLNSRPDQSPSRWVINFQDWPLDRTALGSWKHADEKERKEILRTGHVPSDYTGPVAADYPDCLAIVVEKVKPERDKINRAVRRERWWQFAERAPGLYSTIRGMNRVLIVAQTSKRWEPAFVSLGIVYSHTIIAFAMRTWTEYTLIQSFLHEEWHLKYGPSLETRPRYTPSDCFETFPFPEDLTSLETIGEQYYQHRQSIMQARQEGLTTTYNRFHNPDENSPNIVELRRLHAEMDRQVAEAYGWSDIALDHDFHETKQGMRYTISEQSRRDVLGRLLKLNHERHAAEVEAELQEKSAKPAKGARKRVKASDDSVVNGEDTLPSLWGPEEEQQSLPGLDAGVRQMRLGEE